MTQHLGPTTAPLTRVASLISAMALGQPAHGGHVVQPTTPDGGVHLVTPTMDGERGKEVFVGKGCVACHAVNGVGGHDAPNMDAHTMQGLMNPFDFAARMWNHAPGMIMAQEEALGAQITLTGQELADLIAFVHDEEVQHTFTEADLTPQAREMMDHDHGGAMAPEAHAEELGHHDDGGTGHHSD
jgi:cytochrome c